MILTKKKAAYLSKIPDRINYRIHQFHRHNSLRNLKDLRAQKQHRILHASRCLCPRKWSTGLEDDLPSLYLM